MKLKTLIKKFNEKKLIFRIYCYKKEFPRFIDIYILHNDFYLNDINSNSKFFLWYRKITLNSSCKSDSMKCNDIKQYNKDMHYLYNSQIMKHPTYSYKMILSVDGEE